MGDYFCHYNTIWRRIKDAFTILFIGFLKINRDFLILEGEHIDSFINALIEGKDKILRSKEDK